MTDKVLGFTVVVCLAMFMVSMMLFFTYGWAFDSPLSEPHRILLVDICGYGLMVGLFGAIIAGMTLGLRSK